MTVDPKKSDLRILIDTSTWMHEHAEGVLRQYLAPIVHESGRRIVVPVHVVEEINRHVQSPDKALREKAQRAARLFQSFRDDELVDVFGGSEDSFADNVIQMVVVRFSEKYHFCLFTQDRALAADTLRLEFRKSVRTKSIVAFRVGDAGSLDAWELDDSHPTGARWRTLQPAPSTNASIPLTPVASARDTERFRLSVGAPRSRGGALRVTAPVGSGDYVIDQSGATVRLAERIGAGGEGIVYATSLDLVCKVYDPSILTVAMRDKIRLMLRHPVRHPGICWPCSIATNQKGEFIGYLMKRAHGLELQKTVFIKPLLQKAFPNWNRRDLVALTVRILESIQALHQHNVLLGDINPRNFLIGERGVYLVDTDSYQIEDFPCPVGTATFLTPELLGQNLATVLRTQSQELFAIATLIFMMVMPGKPPFSHMGGGDPAENIRRRHFPYGLAQKRGQGVPAGPWRYMWSHLPFYLKGMFHDIFVDGERPTTDQWLVVMNRYLSDLERGHVADEIFPHSFKRLRQADVISKGGVWQVCTECGSEFGHFETKEELLCPDCRSQEVEIACYLCDKVAPIARRYVEMPVCADCRSSSHLIHCKDCNTEFNLPATERAYFKKMNFTLPKRCPTCRAARKAGRAGPTGDTAWGRLARLFNGT
jgi:predicted Zn-ribbon and HTH transcriptional regulator